VLTLKSLPDRITGPENGPVDLKGKAYYKMAVWAGLLIASLFADLVRDTY